MDNYAKLIASIASLLDAVAWPLLFLGIALLFRSEIRSALSRIPTILDRVKKANLPGGLAFELDRVADAVVDQENNKTGKITPRQAEAAARIAVQAQDISPRALLDEMDRLCLEYDNLRRLLPPGEVRTRTMTRIVAKMRSLAPSLTEFLDIYKGSGSAGSRLAAIAMMQMTPQVADLIWLKERFKVEKQAFLLYHSALALQNLVDSYTSVADKRRLRKAAEEALEKVSSFAEGTPDRGTTEILEMLIASIPN
jgi:hypothetical protein